MLIVAPARTAAKVNGHCQAFGSTNARTVLLTQTTTSSKLPFGPSLLMAAQEAPRLATAVHFLVLLLVQLLVMAMARTAMLLAPTAAPPTVAATALTTVPPTSQAPAQTYSCHRDTERFDQKFGAPELKNEKLCKVTQQIIGSAKTEACTRAHTPTHTVRTSVAGSRC